MYRPVNVGCSQFSEMPEEAYLQPAAATKMTFNEVQAESEDCILPDLSLTP